MRIRAFFCAAAFLMSVPWAAECRSLPFVCALGDVAGVRDALADGADPNAPDENGRRPLYAVVRAGVAAPLSMHLDVIRLLVDSGADVEAPSPDGETALSLSLRKGASFAEVTALLLELGADPNALSLGVRPLHLASCEPASVRQLELLLERGADVRLKDEKGYSPLATAVTALEPSAEKVGLLLGAGAEVNETFDLWGEKGLTPLMAAAVRGSPELVRLLLENGALVALSSCSGSRARDYALSAGREDNAALLR